MAKEYRNVLEDTTRGAIHSVACTRCNAPTRHRVVASRNISDTYEDDTDSFSRVIWDDFEIIECQGCQAVSFRHAHRDTEDELIDHETGASGGLAEDVSIFPHRVARQRIVPPTTPMPISLLRAYPEVVSAYEANLSILCAVGIRLCLEAFCREQAIAGRTLYDQIEALASAGTITTDEASLFHGIRDVGNAAAHEVRPPTQRQVHAAMAVLEGLLYRHYVLPQAGRPLLD